MDGTWQGLGGIIISDPHAIEDSQGKIHVFVIGSDNALWKNVDGTWQGLGGIITSDPHAIMDSQGKVHVFVIGSDNALWDNVDDIWYPLGGYIKSNPSATIEPGRNDHLAITVIGGDDALWLCDLYTPTMTVNWYPLGGVVTSDLYVLAAQENIHTFVRGGDGALWENVFSSTDWHPESAVWYPHGGLIKDNPVAVADGYTTVAVRGNDDALWTNTFETTPAEVPAGVTSPKVELVNRMLELNKKLAEANTGHEIKLIQRQIETTDRQIDRLAYELYDHTEEEVKIVEA